MFENNAVCKLLGIKYPIFQGGMAWIGTAELASAVSNAGGLGLIGAGHMPPDVLRKEIQKCKERTQNPFGVNIMLMSPFVKEVMQVVVDERVPVVTTGAGNPGEYMSALKEIGTKVIPVIASVALARRLVKGGADAVIAEGLESGGHIGEIATFPLIPQVVDALDVPVIAAGGICTRRERRSDGHPFRAFGRMHRASELQKSGVKGKRSFDGRHRTYARTSRARDCKQIDSYIPRNGSKRRIAGRARAIGRRQFAQSNASRRRRKRLGHDRADIRFARRHQARQTDH